MTSIREVNPERTSLRSTSVVALGVASEEGSSRDLSPPDMPTEGIYSGRILQGHGSCPWPARRSH